VISAGPSWGSFVVDGQAFDSDVTMNATFLQSQLDSGTTQPVDFTSVLGNAEYGYQVEINLSDFAGRELTRAGGSPRNSLLRFAGAGLEMRASGVNGVGSFGPFELRWNDNGFTNSGVVLAMGLTFSNTHTVGIHPF